DRLLGRLFRDRRAHVGRCAGRLREIAPPRCLVGGADIAPVRAVRRELPGMADGPRHHARSPPAGPRGDPQCRAARADADDGTRPVARGRCSPAYSLALSSVVAFGIGLAGLLVAIRGGRRGDRLAWIAVAGVVFMLAAIAGLSW